MFSGQGSHYFQMGRELYDRHAGFRAAVDRLDALARSVIGESPIKQAYRGEKTGTFDRLLHTHPAIFIIEHALAECLIEDGIVPDMTLGASLGTFAAASIAGFINTEQALRAVIAQAQVVESNCEPGGMTAIVDEPALFEMPFIRERSTMAGVNFSGHFVVSAGASDLHAIENVLRSRNIVHQRLAVHYAFHSHGIDSARSDAIAQLHPLPVKNGRLPMACCGSAAIHTTAFAPAHLWDVVRGPVRFADTIAHLEAQGAWRYLDVGPSGTLATFTKYAMPKESASSATVVLTPFGRDVKNYEALTGKSVC